jgi:acetyl esterase/lipase
MSISRFRLFAGGLFTCSLGVLSACSTVAVFDAIVPKDEGSVLAQGGIAYGGGERQKLDVYVPRSSRPNAPVIVFMCGGAWNRHTSICRHPSVFTLIIES